MDIIASKKCAQFSLSFKQQRKAPPFADVTEATISSVAVTAIVHSVHYNLLANLFPNRADESMENTITEILQNFLSVRLYYVILGQKATAIYSNCPLYLKKGIVRGPLVHLLQCEAG